MRVDRPLDVIDLLAKPGAWLDAPLDATLDRLAYRGADPGTLGPLLDRFGLSGRLDAVPHRTNP